MGLLLVAPPLRAVTNADCLDCHGSLDKVTAASEALGRAVSVTKAEKLVVTPPPKGSAHEAIACLQCHPHASEVPHPAGMPKENPCATCHAKQLAQVNTSTHRDPLGGASLRASCWACHGAHDVWDPKDRHSTLQPVHVAERCLQCHNKREYLDGVHGQAVQFGGLDVAATCISCHGGHDIKAPSVLGSRVARRNISFTCGKCHNRVAEMYRQSVHGAALTDSDNPDVPTCVDCHAAHRTVEPRSPRFRLGTPHMCGRCHDNKTMMGKYKISTQVFDTYVADFHGTTAELFRTSSPDEPLNKAVCYDCHGYHDVESTRALGDAQIKKRLLVRCQACHPGAGEGFLSAWTGHYVPTPDRYPWIYYVRLFYWWVIPGTVGFFLLYIGVDVWGRRRRQRRSQ